MNFMSKGQVVIIEDEFFVANHLKKIAIEQGFEVMSTYHSAETFLKTTNWEFDAALIDIFLSGKKTGIDVAHDVKRRKKPFLFITANKDEHTIAAAAKLIPEAYIAKPFKPIDVQVALQILAAKIPAKIKINGSRGVEELNPMDICFVKAEGSYIEIHTPDKNILQRKLLGDLADSLPDNFIRVHRSFLVNKNYVESKSAKYWVVRGYEIPLSRNFSDPTS